MAGVTPGSLSRRLQRVQSFKETVWGTQGPATAKWMAILPDPTFTPIYKSTFVDEDRGSLAPAYLSYIPELGGNFTINWDATYEDILFSLASVLGSVAPTGVGPYTYTYSAPLTTAWAPQSYTLELAYDVASVFASGVLTKTLAIKGNSKKNWTLGQAGFFQQYNLLSSLNIASSTNATPIAITTSTPLPSTLITGSQVIIQGHLVNTAANGTWIITTTGASSFTLNGSTGNGIGGATGTVTQTITPNIADRVVEPIIFGGETTLFCDPAGIAPGTTPVPNALVSFELNVDNQQQGFFTGDQKYPTDFTQEKLKITLTLKLKWNQQINALFDTQWALGKSNVFQIKATSGTKSVALNFSGVLSNDPTQYQPEFNAIAQEFRFDALYDSGPLANYLQAIVVNNVSALP